MNTIMSEDDKDNDMKNFEKTMEAIKETLFEVHFSNLGPEEMNHMKEAAIDNIIDHIKKYVVQETPSLKLNSLRKNRLSNFPTAPRLEDAEAQIRFPAIRIIYKTEDCYLPPSTELDQIRDRIFDIKMALEKAGFVTQLDFKLRLDKKNEDHIIYLYKYFLGITLKLPSHSSQFKVNDYLKLKLENRRTTIYVNGKKFMNCKYLLLNIPKGEIEKTYQYDSIDALKPIYGTRHEMDSSLIEPETEFFGHCSNLEAWAENDYDTRILEKRLAFPLLKELAKAGDPTARQKFVEEVARRFITGNKSVRTYLIIQDYVKYLSDNEFETIIREMNQEDLYDLIFYEKFASHLSKTLSTDKKLSLCNKLDRDEIGHMLFDGAFSILFPGDEGVKVLKQRDNGTLKTYINQGFDFEPFSTEQKVDLITDLQLLDTDNKYVRKYLTEKNITQLLELGISVAKILECSEHLTTLNKESFSELYKYINPLMEFFDFHFCGAWQYPDIDKYCPNWREKFLGISSGVCTCLKAPDQCNYCDDIEFIQDQPVHKDCIDKFKKDHRPQKKDQLKANGNRTLDEFIFQKNRKPNQEVSN